MKAVIEGLLFINGEDGLTLDEISNIIELNSEETKKLIDELSEEYNNSNRGIQIEFFGNHYKLTTKAEHKKYYQKLVNNNFSDTLSESALEVLAIIAYNNPITRVEIDEIRGTNSSYIVRKLLIQGLIVDAGRSSLPGKPKLYTITDNFLDCFGLKSVENLPKIERNENEEILDIYETKYNEKN